MDINRTKKKKRSAKLYKRTEISYRDASISFTVRQNVAAAACYNRHS